MEKETVSVPAASQQQFDPEKQLHVQEDPFIASSSSSRQQDITPEEDSQSQQDDDTRAYTLSGWKGTLLVIGMSSANFLYGLDNTIVADLQADISESMQNISQLGWLGVGFTLGSTASILPLGKAYSLFDTKWLFIFCLVMFSAASALCGAAPNMEAMIVGRVWAGSAGAGMYLG